MAEENASEQGIPRSIGRRWEAAATLGDAGFSDEEIAWLLSAPNRAVARDWCIAGYAARSGGTPRVSSGDRAA